MMQGILRDQDIADVQSCIQRAGYTGVDHMGYPKDIRQNLYAQSGIHLADPAADHHRIRTVQGAFVEIHSRLFHDFSFTHIGLELFHFQLHRSDNSYFDHIFLISVQGLHCFYN